MNIKENSEILINNDILIILLFNPGGYSFLSYYSGNGFFIIIKLTNFHEPETRSHQ